MSKVLDLTKIVDDLVEQITSRELKKIIGEYIVERIQRRTRLGKGVQEFKGQPEKLKPLSKSYIKKRIKDSNLSSKTTPKRSNLTRTGQMLDDLTFKIQGDKIEVGFKSRKSALKAGYVSDDRPFLTLSKPEYEGLERIVRDYVKKALR